MKYKDSQGNFQDIYVKVGDNIPVGGEMDFDGNTVPVGWEEVNEEYTLTPVSGGLTGGTYAFFKIGKVCTITGFLVNPSVAVTRTSIATVPNDLKPKQEYQSPATFMDTNSGNFVGYGRVLITTDGTIQASINTARSASTICFVNLTYLIN